MAGHKESGPADALETNSMAIGVMMIEMGKSITESTAAMIPNQSFTTRNIIHTL